MLKTLWIFLGLIGVLAVIVALFLIQAHKQNHVRTTIQEVDNDIRRHLLVGASREVVAAYLDQKGIGHTYVQESKESPEYNHSEIALIRDASFRWPIRTDIQIIFRFDPQGKLRDFTAKEIFTGP